MITRKNLLKYLTGIPIVGLFSGKVWATEPSTRSTVTSRTDQQAHRKPSLTERSGNIPSGDAVDTSTYESLGVTPLINARGTVTIVGATRLLPEVERAMERAVRDYVQLDELMEGVGKRLSELTGAGWGCVTSGASAAVTLATAGCISRGDPDRIWQLPDTSGLKNEVIIPSHSRNVYDVASRAAGARLVEVSNREELNRAMGHNTAMIMLLGRSRQLQSGPLSLEEIVSAARPADIPVLVDAADMGPGSPDPYLSRGADLVAYSGGKVLRGPQCSGLLLGREDLVRAAWITSAPHHGFGRGFKAGREEIMGALASLEVWMRRDHEEEARIWLSRMRRVADRLRTIPGVRTEEGTPERPSLLVEWDRERIDLKGHEMENLLWDNNPRIAVSGAGSYLPFPPNEEPNIRINPTQMKEGEERLVAERVYELLSHPPQMRRASAAPEADLGGRWDLEMYFAAGTVRQRLFLEQTGSRLTGTHAGTLKPRELSGSVHGREILFRSSYTEDGHRLNYEFTGLAENGRMGGRVHMGEYGTAEWSARRPPEG